MCYIRNGYKRYSGRFPPNKSTKIRLDYKIVSKSKRFQESLKNSQIMNNNNDNYRNKQKSRSETANHFNHIKYKLTKTSLIHLLNHNWIYFLDEYFFKCIECQVILTNNKILEYGCIREHSKKPTNNCMYRFHKLYYIILINYIQLYQLQRGIKFNASIYNINNIFNINGINLKLLKIDQKVIEKISNFIKRNKYHYQKINHITCSSMIKPLCNILYINQTLGLDTDQIYDPSFFRDYFKYNYHIDLEDDRQYILNTHITLRLNAQNDEQGVIDSFRKGIKMELNGNRIEEFGEVKYAITKKNKRFRYE